MISVAVLGGVEVRRDGRLLPVPAGKSTQLFVRLALEAGRAVTADRLIDELWPHDPTTSRNTLQSKVSQLRRALGDAALITATTTGYLLDVDPSSVDAQHVVHQAATAAALRAASNPGAAATTASSALALFRGDLLAGVDANWLAPHRARLQEVRWQLVQTLFAARLELGESDALIVSLEALLAEDPLREHVWTLLITALYRAGRQADALASYRRVQQILDDQLGLEPGPELRRLEQQVLRQDPRLAGPGPPLPGNLPALSAELIGRAHDLAHLSALVTAQRLVTITGPAGVGKTRLAIEVARSSTPPGGAWLVRLDHARDATTLLDQLAADVGVVAGTEAQLVERLRGPGMLLVLDNCEHLVDEIAVLTTYVLTALPGLRVLATSQLPLSLDGESCYPLEPLPLADAITLFAERAAERRGTPFTGDEATVSDLVRSLDCLPLAIELAAARTKALSVQEISNRLGDRFTLLNDPARRGQRHQTLHAAISWSYDLLFPDDQRGLWVLSCFADGAPLAGVEDLMHTLDIPPTAALDVITRLADRSLVRAEIGDGGAVRYRLLDSVRAFSSAQLREAGVFDVAARAHARWFAAAADAARDGGRGRQQGDHLAFVKTERANIDSALSWAERHDPLLGLRIANGFGWLWIVAGDGVAGARRVRAALDAAEPIAPVADLLAGLLFTSWLEASAGNLERATADVDRAALLGSGDRRLTALAHWYRSFVLISQGQPVDALAELQQCTPVFREFGDVSEEGGCWLLAAYSHLGLGNVAAGGDACREALRLLSPLGDQWSLAHAEAMLGGLARAEHRYADAVIHFRRAAQSAGTLGFAAAEAHHLSNLGRVQQLNGDLSAALATLRLAVDKGRAAGDFRLVAETPVRQARVLRAAGSLIDARSLLLAAVAWYGEFGGGEGALLAECTLAAMDLGADVSANGGALAVDASTGVELNLYGALGQSVGTDVLARLASVRERAHHRQETDVEVLALDALAVESALAGRLSDARELLSRADALMPAAAHLLAESDRLDAAIARR